MGTRRRTSGRVGATACAIGILYGVGTQTAGVAAADSPDGSNTSSTSASSNRGEARPASGVSKTRQNTAPKRGVRDRNAESAGNETRPSSTPGATTSETAAGPTVGEQVAQRTENTLPEVDKAPRANASTSKGSKSNATSVANPSPAPQTPTSALAPNPTGTPPQPAATVALKSGRPTAGFGAGAAAGWETVTDTVGAKAAAGAVDVAAPSLKAQWPKPIAGAVPRASAPANEMFAAVDRVLDSFDRAIALIDTLGLKVLADQLAAGLGAVRRNFFYQTPEVRSGQKTAALVDGAVQGTVAAIHDIKGASFNYTLYTQPTKGQVALDSSTGAWTYTPDPGQTSLDDVAFTVLVTDTNPKGANLVDASQKTSTFETVKLGDQDYQTFWIQNATSKPITYSGYQSGGEVPGVPGDASTPWSINRALPGATTGLTNFDIALDVDPTKNDPKLNTLMPGEFLQFTTAYYAWNNTTSLLNFSQLDGGQTLQAVGNTTWTSWQKECLSGSQCANTGSASTGGDGPGNPPKDVGVIVFQDQGPETVFYDATSTGDIQVGSASYTKDEFFGILARIMTTDNTTLSNAHYQPYTQLDPLNPPTLTLDGKPLSASLTLPIGWGDPVYNLTPGEASKTLEAAVGAEAQFGFDVGLTGKFEWESSVIVEKAKAGLDVDLGASWDWSKSQEFKVELEQPVPAYSVSVLYTTHDMIAQVGDSATSYYYTTWLVKNNQNLYTDFRQGTKDYPVFLTQPIQDKSSGAGFKVGINGSPADPDFRTSKILRVGDEPLEVNAYAYVGDRGGEGQVWTDQRGTVWTSSDPAVASVTSGQAGGNGVVTAHAPGEATITATYNWTMPNPTGGQNLEGSISNTFLVTVPQQTALTAVKSNGATTLLKNEQDIAYVQYGTGPAMPVTRSDSYWNGEVPINRPNNARFLSIAAGPVDLNTPYLLLDRSDFGAFLWSLDPFGQFVDSTQLTTEQALADAASKFGVPRGDLPSAVLTNGSNLTA